MTFLTDTLALVGVLSVPLAPPQARDARDQELLDAQREVADARRRIDTLGAAVAAEIAHRSRRELGHDGLAQSRGQRTPEGLISQLTGSSAREARTLVKAGELLPVTTPRPEAPPVARWLAVIGEAVGAASISVEAAEVIRTRLGAAGAPGGPVTDAGDPAAQAAFEIARVEATEKLVTEATGITIEQLVVRAARARDELDLAGIVAREDALREKRFLRINKQLDGMTRISGLLDPESAAIIVPVLDAATSPRRGGPRFVDPDAVERAEDIVRDQRSTEQLALDNFVELVRCGARVDPGKLLGDRKPAVRILVTQTDLDASPDGEGVRPGAAFFEGQHDAISVSTAERYICASGAIPIMFDTDGRALNLGREQRLFSEKQRVAMAARDGGCLMCDRPPSWAEAHHIDHWEEHQGRTDIDDGVMLCRFCHLLVHNKRWRITRTGSDYFLERPAEHDPMLRRTALSPRSPALERLLATA